MYFFTLHFSIVFFSDRFLLTLVTCCLKQIRETPHKRHHKFIEYYDVRAAEAALRLLNRSDIAGKRIKLEPSRPGGARRKCVHGFCHFTLSLSLSTLTNYSVYSCGCDSVVVIPVFHHCRVF